MFKRFLCFSRTRLNVAKAQTGKIYTDTSFINANNGKTSNKSFRIERGGGEFQT